MVFGLLIPIHAGAVLAPWSDLTVSQMSAPLLGTTGYPYEINVSVENHGNATSGLISVGFYLSTDNHLTNNDTFIQVTTGDPVRSGTGVQLHSIDTLPLTLTPGEYRLFAYVEDHEGDEKDLIDNTALLSAPVQIKTGVLPDTEIIRNSATEFLYEKTNECRVAEGLAPLTRDNALDELARAYTDRMVAQKFFSHTDPDGHDQSYRAEAAGYPDVKDIEGVPRIGIYENIAYIGTGNVVPYGYVNPTDPESVAGAIMTGWMKSPGHRANILNPLIDRMGVGMSWNGKYWYAAQEFF